MRLHLDFETRSALDVRKVGAWIYSTHPTTDILCAGFAVDDAPVSVLKPETLIDFELAEASENKATIFCAHNAMFEYCIWHNILVKRYGYQPIPVERWLCTSAKACNMSLPRALEGVTDALNLPIRKDMEGNKIMRKLSRPRPKRKGATGIRFYEYDDCPEDFEHLYEYNRIDVEAERLVDKAIPDLNPKEQRLWQLDLEINLRGVHVDVPMVKNSLEFLGITKEKLEAEFAGIVDGAFDKPSQVRQFRDWLAMNGSYFHNLQAATVDRWLNNFDGDDFLKVKRALEIRRQLSKSSTAKYEKLMNLTDMDDHKLRGMFLFYAAITKRWGGRGVQLQNLPRGTVNSDTAINHLMLGDYEWFQGCYPNMMEAYSSNIRGSFIPSPGNEFYVSDFSSIEARVLAWGAGQESTLEIFREDGDPYIVEASNTFGRTITKNDKEERAVGKVEVLALGYNGGIGAMATMSSAYGVDLRPVYDILWPTATEDEQQRARQAYDNYIKRSEKAGEVDLLSSKAGHAADVIKQRWRRNNPNIVQYWSDVENAAVEAVLTGERQCIGNTFNDYGSVSRPTIVYDTMRACPSSCQDVKCKERGVHNVHLVCKLPSGNCIVYPFARISMRKTPWGQDKKTLTYRTIHEKNFQYVRTHTYGGKLVENITQSIARDLLAEAMVRLDDAGFNIVIHVHDEIVADEPLDRAEFEKFKRLMAEAPDWAKGLPIGVDGWRGMRYKK